MEQAHAREARLGDLRRADRVIEGRGLARALAVERLLALAEVHEAGLHPVGDAEIEMAAVGDLEEARRAEILVGAQRVDIGPELAGGLGNAGLAGQIFAAFDYRRREAEVEAEQGRLAAPRGLSSHSSTSQRDQTWSGRISRGAASPRASAIAMPLWRRPLRPTSRSRRSLRIALHLRLRGRAGGFAAVQSRERSIISLTSLRVLGCRSGSAPPAQPS